jgi:hypothetical protein
MVFVSLKFESLKMNLKWILKKKTFFPSPLFPAAHPTHPSLSFFRQPANPPRVVGLPLPRSRTQLAHAAQLASPRRANHAAHFLFRAKRR